MSQENLFDQETTFSPANENTGIRAKIIGVGGAGVSLVDGLRFDDFQGVEHLAVDVDSRALADSIASEKLAFGRRHTRGMGTGGEYLLARKAAEEEKDVIRKHLEGVDLVFLLAGLGGGTGGGAVPVIARLARDAGALVFAFAPLPFSWEKGRHAQAEECLAELRKHANAVVPLPNDSLLQVGGPDATALECFAEAGRNVGKGISAICSLVFRRGMIDVDYAHLRKAFNRRSGRTLFGYGEGEGPDGIRHALRELMVCPMLHLPDVSKAADALLILITGGTGMGMAALQQASMEIRSEFKAGEHVVFGAHVDENMGDRVQITVLGATDLEAGLPAADVAPVSEQVISASPKAKRAHQSKLASQKAKPEPAPAKGKKGKKGQEPLDQNTFEFMEDGNQRGIFDDLPSRNLYEGEDLDVPAYLRRGVKIAV
ncbi:MAG: cell division protein FtsZ [Opitutae bacterium]